MSNPYRDSQSSAQKTDVGQIEVWLLTSNRGTLGPFVFKGFLEKSKDIPNVSIIRHAQSMFNEWKTDKEFYTGVDPQRNGSNGQPIEYVLIPKHAVDMVRYTKTSLFIEHEDKVMTWSDYTEEVIKLRSQSR